MKRTLLRLAIVGLAAAFLPACHKRHHVTDRSGPAQERSIDRSGTKTGSVGGGPVLLRIS
jgi:hypothetical protein